jgi:serine/threonine-protein kinase HipA
VIELAEVRLWGRLVGAVALANASPTPTARFEYNLDFLASRLEVSPLMMPLSSTVYQFPALGQDAFHGLPGLLADSLPDRFGNTLIDAWLATQGRAPGSFGPIERLCYTGARGMGALEFRPVKGPRARKSEKLRLEALVHLASQVLQHRHDLQASFAPDSVHAGLTEILRVGTSAGGARPKALIAWNRDIHEVRSGQVEAPKGFSYWLLKFDGVSGAGDHEFSDPKGFTRVEYGYSLMARAAGIEMAECRLLEEGPRKHFMTLRFDRSESGSKVHMQTLGALAHLDYNQPRAHSYEQAFQVLRQLGLMATAREELYRRCVFNLISRNQDDHVKNIAFLMDERGTWRLSPAYDLTYGYDPANLWMSQHQMSVNGKFDGFTREDLMKLADTVSLSGSTAADIIQEVGSAVCRWEEFAAMAGAPEDYVRQIKANQRLRLASSPSVDVGSHKKTG